MATYWASPTGAATWANAESETALSGAACCSLTTARDNADAGDTVNLRAGTYVVGIVPANSGSSGSPITFQAYDGEAVTIKNDADAYLTYYHGVGLYGKSWIKVDGIRFTSRRGNSRLFWFQDGASYNELKDCVFTGDYYDNEDGEYYGSPKIWDGTIGSGGDACVHNWIHGCTIAATGKLGLSGSQVDDGGGMYVGVPANDNISNYNTIEDCTFYAGGHHNLELYTKYNVVRNCYFHHEGAFVNNTGVQPKYGPDTNGRWGNRNVQFYDGYNENKWTLVESNRFGHAGPPPDDDGGDGLTITGPAHIVRFNCVFNSLNNGVLFKIGASSRSDNNRFYNNTVYKSGRFDNRIAGWTGQSWQGTNLRWYKSWDYVEQENTWPEDNVVKNNIFYNGAGGDVAEETAGSLLNTVENNHWTSDGDPVFLNTDVSDPTDGTKPDLTPTGAGIENAGIHLTTATGAGSSSTTLVVSDAQYFQDGTWGSSLSDIQADVIAIGTVDNTVQISSIDYATNTITLASAVSWSAGASVWLHTKSDGEQVLFGTAPDLGAVQSSIPVDPPAAPTGLSATGVSTSQIDLAWTDNATDETHHVIERSLSEVSGFSEVGRTSPNVEEWSDSSLDADTTYYYKVYAINAGGSSSEITANATTDAAPANAVDTEIPATTGGTLDGFTVDGDYIYQTVETTDISGAEALYEFDVTVAGDYRIICEVEAVNTASDSFFIQIDAQPTTPDNVWDVLPLTVGTQSRTVGWRGTGTPSAPETPNKEWTLDVDTHTVYVRGREANCKLKSIMLQLQTANAAPVADAGSDVEIELPTSTTSLDGSGSSDDVGITTWLWEQIDGPAEATIADADTSTPDLSDLVEGVYTFLLTVTDVGALSDSDTVSVTVVGTLIADAGEDQLDVPGLPLRGDITLDASGTTGGTGTVTYLWEYLSGPSIPVFDDQTLEAPSVTGLIAGEYVFQVTAMDDDDVTSVSNLLVVVYGAPTKPSGLQFTS